jgi:hypothetical protein
MDESESPKYEIDNESTSADGSRRFATVAKTEDATAVKAGPGRKASFSWFRLIVAVAAAGMLFMVVGSRIPGLKRLLGEVPVTWEYRVVSISPETAHDRGLTIEGGMAQNQIDVSDAQLNALGLQGWELAGSYLEMETAFPNFGDSKYVTGLRDNVRPQRLVLILKRPARDWPDQSSR